MSQILSNINIKLLSVPDFNITQTLSLCPLLCCLFISTYHTVATHQFLCRPHQTEPLNTTWFKLGYRYALHSSHLGVKTGIMNEGYGEHCVADFFMLLLRGLWFTRCQFMFVSKILMRTMCHLPYNSMEQKAQFFFIVCALICAAPFHTNSIKRSLTFCCQISAMSLVLHWNKTKRILLWLVAIVYSNNFLGSTSNSENITLILTLLAKDEWYIFFFLFFPLYLNKKPWNAYHITELISTFDCK